MKNQRFADYVTGTAFNLTLSAPMIRGLYFIASSDIDAMIAESHTITTLTALQRRGLIERNPAFDALSKYEQQRTKTIYHERLTLAGKYALELCNLAGLLENIDRARIVSRLCNPSEQPPAPELKSA